MYQSQIYDFESKSLLVRNIQDEQIKYRRVELADSSTVEEYTDANGNLLRSWRNEDEQGRMEVFEHPNGLRESRSSDAAQTYMNIENRNGKTLRFTYDSLKRRTSYSHATGKASCAYDYKENTDRIAMAANNDQFDSVFLDFDEQRRVVEVREKGMSSF